MSYINAILVEGKKNDVLHTSSYREVKALGALRDRWKFEMKKQGDCYLGARQLISKNEGRIKTRPFPSYSPGNRNRWIWKVVGAQVVKDFKYGAFLGKWLVKLQNIVIFVTLMFNRMALINLWNKYLLLNKLDWIDFQGENCRHKNRQCMCMLGSGNYA